MSDIEQRLAEIEAELSSCNHDEMLDRATWLVAELRRAMRINEAGDRLAIHMRIHEHGGRFPFKELAEYDAAKSGSIRERLDRVYEAGGKAWDKIEDPQKFIDELRGYDDASEEAK